MFISESDDAIRDLLINYGKIDPLEIDIAFEKPNKEWAAGVSKPTVDFYLYSIQENTELRTSAPRIPTRGPNNTAILAKPEVRIDLSYNVTVFASEISDEHRLLSRVLWTLMRYPVLPADILQGTMAGHEIQTSTANPNQAIIKASDYWSVIDTDLKASIDYKLITKLDLEDEVTTDLVLTSQLLFRFKDGNDGVFEKTPSTLAGRIHAKYDHDIGVAGAQINVLERALNTQSDADGQYILKGLSEGTYTLLIRVEGYEETRTHITVPSNDYDIGI
jgi:hypothetical protein